MLRPPRRTPGSVSHRRARAPKTDGCEKKNGSIQRNREAISQAPIKTMRSAACSVTTSARLLPVIGCHDLLLEVAPDRFVDFGESRNESCLRNIAWPRQ